MENSNGIITNLYCYHSTLFVSYLTGMIKSFDLPESWFKYLNVKAIRFEIKPSIDFAIEMQALDRYLYVATPKNLIVYNLRSNDRFQGDVFKEIDGCSKIKIDYKNKLLFAASEQRGLIVFDISKQGNPRYLKDFNLKSLLNVDNYNLSDIDVVEGFVFLSLRGIGIVRLDYMKDQNEFSHPQIVRMIQKVQLDDPQEAKYNIKNKILYIIDSTRGVVLLSTENNTVLSEKLLPNGDKPKRVIIQQENAIIQGDKGLYYYNKFHDVMHTILDYKIGAIAKYYNHYILSKNNNIHLVNIGKTGIGFDRDEYSYFGRIFDYTSDRTIELA